MISRRRPLVILASVAVVFACSDHSGSVMEPGEPVLMPAPVFAVNGNGIRDEYIVVLKEDAAAAQPGRARGRDPDAVAQSVGALPRFVYRSVLNGFAVRLNANQLERLRQHPDVAYIEQDQETFTDATQVMDKYGDPWGLDRIDQAVLPLSKTYSFVQSAANVYAYIIDTGIDVKHPEFQSRAVNVFSAYGGSAADCNGHGTAVAAVVGGKTYGVAKVVRLRGVRVTDCRGSGTVSAVIKAIDWVRVNRRNPAVANISISSTYSAAFNTAIDNLALSGVFVSTAAGNNNGDACMYSPSSAARVITVAATTKTDARATYSNKGKCVALYGPGSSIRTAHLNSGAANWTGTSFAAPHVAGVAALYKSAYGNVGTGTIVNWLRTMATSNVVKNNPSGTPNRLLFKSTL